VYNNQQGASEGFSNGPPSLLAILVRVHWEMSKGIAKYLFGGVKTDPMLLSIGAILVDIPLEAHGAPDANETLTV